MSIRVLVIGTGKMGMAHLTVLKDLKPEAIGAWAPSSRSKSDVNKLGIIFFETSLSKTIQNFIPSHVIISSPIETLHNITVKIINLGVKNILIEKPMVLDKKEAESLVIIINKKNVNAKVAYNRRYYSSFIKSLELIKNSNETIESVYFEFNENYDFLDGPSNKQLKVKKKWILANSIHVIDLAFSQVGLPICSNSSFCRKKNDLKWHPSGSIFYGSGVTENFIPFVYHANWKSPGSWKIEWMTNSSRYIFNPIEKLKLMKRGSFKIEDVKFDNSLDIKYKPGVFLQNKDFLYGDESKLVSPEYAIRLLNLAEILGGYNE